MTDCNNICRIITHETPSGTYYLAQRWVYKKHCFRKNGYEWEYFFLTKRADSGKAYFEKLEEWEFEDRVFLNIGPAEYYCKQWARTNNTGETVKAWTADSVT